MTETTIAILDLVKGECANNLLAYQVMGQQANARGIYCAARDAVVYIRRGEIDAAEGEIRRLAEYAQQTEGTLSQLAKTGAEWVAAWVAAQEREARHA